MMHTQFDSTIYGIDTTKRLATCQPTLSLLLKFVSTSIEYWAITQVNKIQSWSTSDISKCHQMQLVHGFV